MIKVRIKKLPKAKTGYQVQGSLANDMASMGGNGVPKLRESKYITAVPRDEANLEAEGGETVYGDINGDGMPEHKIIKGPRHAQGGVPLNLPEDTFIFSDTRGMLIKDPELLNMFGKGGTNKSFTPAELAKQYDVQKYRKILEDPETDAIERKTAELMIKKYVVKLGCLALAQESMKGFPQGIPAVARPCMQARGLTEEDVMPNKEITVLNDQLKKQMEQKEGAGDENMLQQATDMNEGNPVAQPQEQMQQPSPEEMMRYGGMRRLRRAQQGMEQPSEEEMMMMQQQGQGSSQQEGGQEQMQQIMQQVGQALQQGAQPEEVIVQLLQGQIPPEAIMQIFVQLGMPQEQVGSLIQSVMSQSQGGQEQQMQQEPQQDSQQEPQMSQEEMMRYGGIRKLKRAQEGMQQPSPEQMAMMQQEQGQQQEQGDQDQMGEIIQEVQSALERGAEPSDVVISLLENGVPPESIVQIFAQLGASPEEANGLVQQVMQQAQGGEEQMMQEQPMSEEEAMMMQQQQMQQQAPPMAMYGMSMGGYDMPFYDMPEASRGMTQTTPKRIPLRKAQDGIEVPYDPKWDTDPTAREKALRLAYAQARKKGANTKIYVVKDGKKIEQKISATGFDKYSGTDLDKFNGNQVAAATYEAMTQTFNDPDAKAAFGKQVRLTLSDKESYKGKGGGYSKTYQTQFGKDPSTLSDDEIVKKYLRMQERNLKTTTYGKKIFGDDKLPFGTWMYKDNNGNIREYESVGSKKGDNKGFKDVVKEANPNLTDAQIKDMYTKISSSGFNSLEKISEDMGLPMKRIAGSGKASAPYDEEAYIQQGAFIAADKLMKDLDANPNNYDDKTAAALLGITSFAGFNPYGKQSGYNDETGMGISNISPIDAYYTNTTQGENQAVHGLKFEDLPDTPEKPCASGSPEAIAAEKKCKDEGKEFDLSICGCKKTPDKKCPCKKADGTVIEMAPNADGTCPPCDDTYDVPGPPPEYWLQDTIKTTGAFGDLMGIKKQMPFAPGVDLETPRPTFLDPTRELAANAEQANIQTQGMAQFAGPQALSSRSSSVQGQAAKNAADVLSKYNNANVNIANQFEMKGTDIRNQESMLKQATAQRVYDQNTVANQQFDNAKLAMRNNLRNYYTNAITNKEKTDALNQMYPNYAVSPGVGGRMNYRATDKQFSPQNSNTMTMQEAMDWCKKNNPTATDHSACMQRVMNQQSGNTKTSSNANSNAVNTMYPGQKMGGPVFQDGGFVHIDSWLPFIS